MALILAGLSGSTLWQWGGGEEGRRKVGWSLGAAVMSAGGIKGRGAYMGDSRGRDGHKAVRAELLTAACEQEGGLSQ